MGRSLRVRDISSNRDLFIWILSYAGENGYHNSLCFGYESTWGRICFKPNITGQGDRLTSAEAFIVYQGVDVKGHTCLKVRALDRTPSLTVFFEKLEENLKSCRRPFAVHQIPHNAPPEAGGNARGPHLWHELIADTDLLKLAIDPEKLTCLSTRWSDRPQTGGVISDQMQGI